MSFSDEAFSHFVFTAYCTGLLLARRVLAKFGLSETYEGNTTVRKWQLVALPTVLPCEFTLARMRSFLGCAECVSRVRCAFSGGWQGLQRRGQGGRPPPVPLLPRRRPCPHLHRCQGASPGVSQFTLSPLVADLRNELRPCSAIWTRVGRACVCEQHPFW